MLTGIAPDQVTRNDHRCSMVLQQIKASHLPVLYPRTVSTLSQTRERTPILRTSFHRH
ncbi:BAH_G0000050.mRNA.1.CDS.1 [Saccharomyces cerevisiae]|nr:BAH_G0000050.mRNA.1.CDS.1 [Saccharomyces cerevisiae]CAI7033020.1 BAH_G0000050.mRNA.1.CDS.1 [Saccharomyces cerevisiae]